MGDDDQLLVVVGVASTGAVLAITTFGGWRGGGNGVGFWVVMDVAREEEGEGPMGAAGEAVDDFILAVGSGESLLRCVGHPRLSK